MVKVGLRFNICEQVINSSPRIIKMSLLQNLKINTHFKYLSSMWLIIEA